MEMVQCSSGLVADKINKRCIIPPARGRIKRKIMMLLCGKIKQACTQLILGRYLLS
ncbi:uncharacterized protein G2W53_030745 [Senna tora]|uniref:Uncharacterized protein n=1 Tax=Senna tora TaxID=362788 RepID=A0A834T812_9FABA|nr:uncharacterized protein G2W53_030745 [Senna tora]